MLKSLGNKGLTLVEILATIVITSIIMIFVTSILINANNNQERVLAESNLRDEADYLISQLLKEFYTIKSSSIEVNVSSSNSLLHYTVPYKIEYASSSYNNCTPTKCVVASGFVKNATSNNLLLVIKGTEIAPLHSAHQIALESKLSTGPESTNLNPSSTVTIPPGMNLSFLNSAPTYQINLVLSYTKNGKEIQLKFENEVTIINN